jgi:hypothetical protein
VKHEYIFEMSFLSISGHLGYLVYCFLAVCVGWKFTVFTLHERQLLLLPDSFKALFLFS